MKTSVLYTISFLLVLTASIQYFSYKVASNTNEKQVVTIGSDELDITYAPISLKK